MRLPETITRQFLSCFKFILLIKLQKDTLHAGHLNFCIGFERKPFHLYHFALQFYDVIRILIVQELAIKKRHQAYRIAAIVHIARLKPKS